MGSLQALGPCKSYYFVLLHSISFSRMIRNHSSDIASYILFLKRKKAENSAFISSWNLIYLSVSNNAATNDLAENGRKSSIFSPTPI